MLVQVGRIAEAAGEALYEASLFLNILDEDAVNDLVKSAEGAVTELRSNLTEWSLKTAGGLRLSSVAYYRGTRC